MSIIPLALKELKSSFLDWRFIGTILISFVVTLFITGVLVDSVSSFSQGNMLSSLPISNKLVKIAVVENGPHPSVGELEKMSSTYVVKTDLKSAQRMLAEEQVHAIYIVNETSGVFIGSNKPISVLAELSVKEAVDKIVRAGEGNKYDFGEDAGLKDLVRGLLTPILLFSPLFIWGLPIIQSIAYDRENRVLEVLFTAPIDRRRILLSKILANMLFVAVVGAVWVGIVHIWGFGFFDPLGVYVVLLVVAFLMITMNALVSSISRNIQEATLASSISSTIIFTGLFLITMLNVFPPLAFLANVSPATYIAKQISEPAAFPVYPLLTLLVVTFSALVLALSAFSTEAFAFSVKPGVWQLYEGMIDILGGGWKAAVGMGFVAFSLTSPAELIVAGLLFFVVKPSMMLAPALLFLALAGVEEGLKAMGTYVMKPRGLLRGLFFGAVVGVSFGIGESLLFIPVYQSTPHWIENRAAAVAVHVVCSMVSGVCIGWGNRLDGEKGRGMAVGLGMLGVLLAMLLHGSYNAFGYMRLLYSLR